MLSEDDWEQAADDLFILFMLNLTTLSVARTTADSTDDNWT
jgi:hypothetical protein